MAEVQASGVPLSSEAQDAKEAMQQQLVRKMALKMLAEAEEEERARRVREAAQPQEGDEVRQRALDQIITVQEDLVRVLNRMKVKEAEEVERAQRVTQEKKYAVHDELIRKAKAQEVKEQVEQERQRLIEESENPASDLNIERNKTYERLVMVQEHLLHHVRGLKANAAMKEEQERRITEDNKQVVHEQLIQAVHKKQAAAEEEKERERRVSENQSEDEAKRRMDIALKMVDVQKELLAAHPPTKAIHGTLSQEVLEDAKVYMQEQLLRKAAQKRADEAADAEQQRRMSESGETEDSAISEIKGEVLTEITRRASIKEAKALADATQQEYVAAEKKAKAVEETVRKVHQQQADKAMDKEKEERVEEMKSKSPHYVSDDLKKEITTHQQKQ